MRYDTIRYDTIHIKYEAMRGDAIRYGFARRSKAKLLLWIHDRFQMKASEILIQGLNSQQSDSRLLANKALARETAAQARDPLGPEAEGRRRALQGAQWAERVQGRWGGGAVATPEPRGSRAPGGARRAREARERKEGQGYIHVSLLPPVRGRVAFHKVCGSEMSSGLPTQAQMHARRGSVLVST